MGDNNNWDYFSKDRHYSDVLKNRLANGEEMDSARAMADYITATCEGDIRVIDFGGGPGHYYPVIKRAYTAGSLSYTSVDIDESNINFGNEYFRDDEAVQLKVGSVLDVAEYANSGANCVISANTLPHVPSIVPLMTMLRDATGIRYFIFRMLVGKGCVQIKNHLLESNFDDLFENNFQFNNIYSLEYIRWLAGEAWDVEVQEDRFDLKRLENHRLPAQDSDPFYANRVSRPVGSMVFKGDLYMPWKFVIGKRKM